MLSFFDMETNTTKKDPLKFGAADYLLTKIIAVGFVLVSAIVTIVSPIIDWASGKPLSVRLDGLNQGPAVTAKPGVTVQHDTHLLAQFSDASAGLWLANLAPAILFVICMAVVVWLLWKLLDDVRDGRPFTRRNVTRMRLIAITIIGGSILLFTVQGLVHGHLLSTALPDTVMLFANNSSFTFFALLTFIASSTLFALLAFCSCGTRCFCIQGIRYTKQLTYSHYTIICSAKWIYFCFYEIWSFCPFYCSKTTFFYRTATNLDT